MKNLVKSFQRHNNLMLVKNRLHILLRSSPHILHIPFRLGRLNRMIVVPFVVDMAGFRDVMRFVIVIINQQKWLFANLTNPTCCLLPATVAIPVTITTRQMLST